ncbi:MAG TPA: DUF1127 domain-containing protein [Beijerinckiaceae bacterium]|jgi:uncharacterized protein YjiS (DUF1127 family)
MIGISIALKLTASFATVSRVAFRPVARVVQVLRHRGEVKQLADLDDRALADIGLTRSDVTRALNEPWLKDPSSVLLVRSVDHRVRGRLVAVKAVAPRIRAAHPARG